MYAQTVSYGLLTARISRPAGIVRDNLRDMVPVTNPFLRDLLETFLTVGGRKGKIEFDELGVGEVVQMLRDADMEAVLRDFGDRNPQEDPAIHFYQLFLQEYDPEKRVKRGVFYTPRPVVSYIVRSVHELLQSEFGLPEGLASTVTWGEMAERHAGVKVPEGTGASSPFVQILDPAVGTGTFLVEVVDIVHKTMLVKWQEENRLELEIPGLWNEYVSSNLLPRLHGYELMMAPYAIAHMKIGLKLHETGYHFGSEERARIYLTNSLEPSQDFSDRLAFDAPALAHEAEAVNAVKARQHFTVVVGNPPYSGHSWNLTPELRQLVEPYRFVDGERIREKGALQLEKSIQDDYIKFVRLAELQIVNSKIGIVGLVTSHGFLDSLFLRGVRSSLRSTFSTISVLDLHGNGLRHEVCPDGSPDKNVFDITRTGIAISLCRLLPSGALGEVCHADLWGDRDPIKYPWLIAHSLNTTQFHSISPGPPTYLFIPQDSANIAEYEKGWSVGEIMPIHSKGVVTGRDAFVIDFDETALLRRMRIFAGPSKSDRELVQEFSLNPSDWWDVQKARKGMPPSARLSAFVRPLLYRPFDVRPCFYHAAVFMSPRRPVMKHIEPGLENVLLVTSRMTKGESFRHVGISRGLVEAIFLSSKTSNNAIVFPLYLYADENELSGDGSRNRRANYIPAFVKAVSGVSGLQVVDGRGDYEGNLGVEDIFDYIVAILQSPAYRLRYAAPLTRDFPRIPLTQRSPALSRRGGTRQGAWRFAAVGVT